MSPRQVASSQYSRNPLVWQGAAERPAFQEAAPPADVVFGYVRSVSDRLGYPEGCKETLAGWCARQGWELWTVFADVRSRYACALFTLLSPVAASWPGGGW